MIKPLTLDELYEKKLRRRPETIQGGVGQFNVFNYEDFIGPDPKPVPYSRREYYKISFLTGNTRYFYADKAVEVKNAALVFANPMVPYNWERLSDNQSGYFCVFTEEFFTNFGAIRDYPIFQPGSTPIYEVDPGDIEEINRFYLQMIEEINSDYAYKYDLIKTLVIQLIHKAIKLQPAEASLHSQSNANDRISSLFSELLERQFPIESPIQRMKLRSPNDFANNLSVHINHLNRALKATMGQTTSQLISSRIMQEARILLRHTNWQISEIGYCLGFEEPSHFISFFKKTENVTPRLYRTQ
ncbi:helix-turn-helix transcriptional regulator [uncultured Imperialibacter sp.]|uniref:helix-turn-helix domain-containing protein n=1 Tax=uncultured Imperialibacter sp. TaxID=1672639 RepID=UPI0030DBD268|tara:strand:- start:6293 stop:7192 length:900 start_codon:yes stop_codon:yes gene_type:complete